MAGRTLDLPDLQVLARYEEDGDGFFWHHRLLLVKLQPGIWITLTPDGELERIDLNTRRHLVCDRNSAFPSAADENEIYGFDPITRAEVQAARKRARTQAAILGDEAPQDAEAPAWRYSDPTRAAFGDAVPADVVDDDERFVYLGDLALVQTPDGQVVPAERVGDAGLDAWRTRRHEDSVDVRTLGVFRDSNGRRDLGLREAIPKFREDPQADWPHEGPRVAKEVLQAVAEGPGNLVSYHMEWLGASGVSETSAQAHEHRHCCEVLRQAVAIDQLDVSNLACLEQVSRRLVQVEMAVSRNPRHPDYTGLGVIVDGPVSATGAARVPGFRTWVTQRQQEQANILKQQRLYSEEAAAQRKCDGDRAASSYTSATASTGADGPPPRGRGKARGRDRGRGARGNDGTAALGAAKGE